MLPNSIEITSGESSKVSPKKGWIKWCIATAISVGAAFGAYHYLSKDSVQQKESLPDFAVGKPWRFLPSERKWSGAHPVDLIWEVQFRNWVETKMN